MNCSTFKAEIELLDAGELLSRGASEHAASCDACRAFQRERASLRRLVGGLEPVAAPTDFEFRLRARMAARRDAGRGRAARLRLTPAFASALVVACFALTVASVVYFRRQPSAERRQLASEQPAPARQVEGLETRREAAAGMTTEAASTAPTAEPDAATNPGRGVEAADANPLEGVVRTNARPARRNVLAKARGNAGSENVAVYSNRGARVYTASGEPRAGHSPFAVAVRVSSPPLRVVLRDERGEPKTLSMKRVSFGAQGPVRRGAKMTLASLSAKEKEGVW